MQKIINIEEVESTLKKYTNIEEPIIVKRENKGDVIMLSIDEYKKRIFFSDFEKKIEEAENDIKKGNVHKARDVFKELRDKYGY